MEVFLSKILVSVFFFLLLTGFEFLNKEPSRKTINPFRIVFWILSAAWVVVLSFLVLNHIRFPLHLEIMEGTILQHVQRAANGEPIYPAPSPDFVPLAYNPLYYWLCVPFCWVLDLNLVTLRFVSILGFIGTAGVLYWVTHRSTRSHWWSLVCVGLFASAYRVMDAYLDTAHSDSWYLFSAVLGTALMAETGNLRLRFLGFLFLVLSFWFKQHGALFVVGALLYCSWKESWKTLLLYWTTALLLGGVAYLCLGPVLFGSHFHYFTWQVPSGWTEFSVSSFVRYFKFLFKNYLFLGGAALIQVLLVIWNDFRKLTLWHIQLATAISCGFMGALDPWSSDNVFIITGVWIILHGTVAMAEFSSKPLQLIGDRTVNLVLLVSFGLLFFNPIRVLTSPRAEKAYQDFIGFLKKIEGTVYAPTIGQLQSDYRFYPAIHWVALEDMIRGPGKDTRNHPLVRRLLVPLFTDEHPVYILENHPLDYFPWFEFLTKHFVLVRDLGDRFKPLRDLPGRFNNGWPRYLYRYTPLPKDPAESP